MIAFSQNTDMNGRWKMINTKGSFLDYYQDMRLEIAVNKKDAVIVTKMGPKRKYKEKLAFTTDGKINQIQIEDGTFATNIHMGLRLPLGAKKQVTANWEKDKSLKVVEKYDFFASQGKKQGKMTYIYRLSPNKDLLTCQIIRSTRKKRPETKFVFKRYEDNNAYLCQMVDDWDIYSKLPEKACWISIQGIVNEKKPLLYFTFGP
jgi:hypothetical protein